MRGGGVEYINFSRRLKMGTFFLVVFCILIFPLILRFLAINIQVAAIERASGEIGCATLILIAIVVSILIAIFV